MADINAVSLQHTVYPNVNYYGSTSAIGNSNYTSSITPADTTISSSKNASSSQKVVNSGCETCKNRKYVDVSNESNVSFQSPAHISPAASASVVASHEREHVANAVSKGSQPGAKLVSSSVRLISSVCPECGRRYIAGGVTNTTIQYSSNPYSASKKSLDGSILSGANVDTTI